MNSDDESYMSGGDDDVENELDEEVEEEEEEEEEGNYHGGDGENEYDVQNEEVNQDNPQYAEADENDTDENNSSDDEDEYLDDDNYEKFDEHLVNNYIKQIHPESNYKTNEEMAILSVVERDPETGIINDKYHTTTPIMTKYEFTRIIGMRISQLAQGAKPYIRLKNHIVDYYIIAETELRLKKLPYIINRPLPNGRSEYWKISDLEIL